MTQKQLMIWNLVLLIVILGMAVIYHIQEDTITKLRQQDIPAETAKETKIANMDYVYTICNESRLYDTATEELCGELLNYYSFDFICQAANKELNNKCQIEEIKL